MKSSRLGRPPAIVSPAALRAAAERNLTLAQAAEALGLAENTFAKHVKSDVELSSIWAAGKATAKAALAEAKARMDAIVDREKLKQKEDDLQAAHMLNPSKGSRVLYVVLPKETEWKLADLATGRGVKRNTLVVQAIDRLLDEADAATADALKCELAA